MHRRSNKTSTESLTPTFPFNPNRSTSAFGTSSLGSKEAERAWGALGVFGQVDGAWGMTDVDGEKQVLQVGSLSEEWPAIVKLQKASLPLYLSA